MTSQMDVKKEVSNLIRSLGIPCNLIGYEYCRAAILLCYNDKKFLRSMSDLYKFLGEKYSCTPNSIERAISDFRFNLAKIKFNFDLCFYFIYLLTPYLI